MRNKDHLLVFLVLSLIGVTLVYGDVPTVTDIEITAEVSGATLVVNVRHSGPTSNHYVSKIEVTQGDETLVYDLDPQDSVTFKAELPLESSDGVEVRAFCNLHGWSQWVSSGEDVPEPNSEPDSGIPGFPLTSMLLGLAIWLLVSLRPSTLF